MSVVEVQAPSNTSGNQWEVVRPSRYARRITAATPMRITGPAAGHPMMRTAADPNGTQVLGTLNNCAHGYTPWGTYLTCEENFVNYFNGPDAPDAHQRRWGMRKTGTQGYRWHEHEERFDAVKHPNEFNRFGWMVEIDPMDPTSTPIKRTALGRAAHEGAAVATTADGRADNSAPDTTCGNWTKSGEGSAIVGHHDRIGLNESAPMKSWNMSHPSRGCSMDALKATGGGGLLYCFAAN